MPSAWTQAARQQLPRSTTWRRNIKLAPSATRRSTAQTQISGSSSPKECGDARREPDAKSNIRGESYRAAFHSSVFDGRTLVASTSGRRGAEGHRSGQLQHQAID